MNLQEAIAIERGRLASDATRPTFEDVRVTCRRCGGVTVFPVLLNEPRKAGQCFHCGETV